MNTISRRTLALASAAALLAIAAAAVAWLNVRGEEPVLPRSPALAAATPATIERGAYLARAGNCAACHTERGGQPFAGGKGIATPFGTVYASNLTPDPETGIGRWSESEFWRALHHGRSRDGRLLYPAFPYPEYTLVTREDSDALFAYLSSLRPVRQADRPHDLRFPYNLQASLAVWRALFFSPGEFRAEPARSAQWNRGAYLARGLGHCEACHAPRNAFGATTGRLEMSGGLIPMQGWYAPSLASPKEAGVQQWSIDEAASFLKSGVSPHGAAMGPMAEVVYRSTQHMNDADLRALASFLKDIPEHEPPAPEPVRIADSALALGGKLYGEHCAQCHGEHGEGGGRAYPTLAGHRAVTQGSPANLVKIVLHGGFPPATAVHPRPYGMPPFGQSLTDAQIAAIASFVRGAWGNSAPAVTALQVQQLREGQ
jgi:mono/diheme cytochrome c family protein